MQVKKKTTTPEPERIVLIQIRVKESFRDSVKTCAAMTRRTITDVAIAGISRELKAANA